MRKLGSLAVLLAAAACGGSGSSPETTPTPAASTASASTSAAPNPCSGGDCVVSVTVGSDVEGEFIRRQANYKVYAGCPRNIGINGTKGDSTNAAGLRGRQSQATSRTATIEIPGTFTGRLATVAMFMGSAPVRYTVVDFGASRRPTVNFGYRWEANRLADDLTIVNTNNSSMVRLCR